MKKLKKKVFLVIFLILTLFTTGILVVYNAQQYTQQYQAVERILSQTAKIGFGKNENKPNETIAPPDDSEQPNFENGEQRDFDRGEFDNIRFIDSTVYTILLNSDNSIGSVINHSDNNMSEGEIELLAVDMIAAGESQNIGNLYFDTYSYSFESGRSLVIVDNSSTNSFLRTTLIITLLIYLALEIIIFFISRLLTLWIAKPVAESFDKQKQFIADASHELKTPLAVIIASADALETNPAEGKWLANIKSESDRMSKLIADLLELAKSESVDDKAQFSVGNLSKVVEMSTLTFEGIMFEKGVMLEDNIEEGIELSMNQYQIKQLMSILIDNAIKHSEKGGEIKVSLQRDKDIVLTVTNKGEGIPKGEEEKIFERFYRADESRNRNENRYGLGLAIAKNICASHSADISAKSENGYTTFTVIFKK